MTTHSTRCWRAAALAASLAAATFGAAPASAAITELHPTAAQREVASDAQGWSATTHYGGVCLVPGLTCPATAATYRTTGGGAGGASDGYLRTSVATTVGLLSSSSAVWTSPTFTLSAPASSAVLQLERRADVSALLSVNGAVTASYTLVNTVTGARTAIAEQQPVHASSGYVTVAAGSVDGAALPAGEPLRLELATHYATPVSVATSGSVDYDRVRLTTTQLTPPSGLGTPAVTIDASGVWINGNVHTHGLPTSLQVHFGPSPAGGSLSSPLAMPGAASAAGYAIALHGLTPGQQYHAWVVATSSDGSTSSTPITFTAPPLPANGPPQVSGAASSRTRHVSFDRTPEVLSATIELRRNGSLIDSFPLPTEDAATITLPDLDGDYELRVVRTIAGDTLHSPDASVELDRIAPSLAALNLDVQPRVAASTLRHLSFARPLDAFSVTAQLLGAGGVPVGPAQQVQGDAQQLELPTVAGEYHVRLTLTDGAGNATTALSPELALISENSGPAPADSPPTGSPSAGDPPQAPAAPAADEQPGTPTSPSADALVTRPTAPGELPSGQADGAAALARCEASGLAFRSVRVHRGMVRVEGVAVLPAGAPITIREANGQRLATTEVMAAGQFIASFAARNLETPLALARVMAQSGARRSRALRIERGNELASTVRSGGVLTLTGVVTARYRRGKLAIAALAAPIDGRCAAPRQALTPLGRPTIDRATGRYRLQVRVPSGGLLIRSSVRSSRGGQSLSMTVAT